MDVKDFEEKIKRERIQRIKGRIQEALRSHYNKEVPFELVLVIPVLYKGWECDEENYIVYTEKKEYVYINSNHGGLFVDPDYAQHIENRLQEYGQSQEAFEKAKKLLKK